MPWVEHLERFLRVPTQDAFCIFSARCVKGLHLQVKSMLRSVTRE